MPTIARSTGNAAYIATAEPSGAIGPASKDGARAGHNRIGGPRLVRPGIPPEAQSPTAHLQSLNAWAGRSVA
jgi:hypothetical protein